MAANLAELMQNMSLTKYAVGSEHWVHVTHINDPGDFYVRLSAYKEFIPELKAHEGPADPSKLNFGSVVVFKSKIKKCHVRGQIRNMKDDNGAMLYDLFALDYGFTEQSVSIDRIKEPKATYPMPALVLHCQLKDCLPKDNIKFDSDAIDAMKFFVGKEKAQMTIHGRTADKYIVELVNTRPDIATILALSDYTRFGYVNNVISRISEVNQPKLFYTYKQLKIGDTLNVRFQSGESLKSFYVCEVDDHKLYNNDIKVMWQYYRRENAFPAKELKCGKALAVFSDWHMRYERAVIKEVVLPEKKAVVQLVDWGTKNDVYVGVSQLKAMSREYFFSKPVMAIYCTAEEIRGNGLHKCLRPGYEFAITVKEVGHQLETPNVVSISLNGK